ncbi:MAG: hypothetical protein KAU26_01290, partial [Methylococcales bacterium]|nr:hypothetical protein [Methylococcales bacterium]
MTLTLKTITLKQWQFQGIKLQLGKLSQSQQEIGLSIERLSLPKPFNDVKLINIRCLKFVWTDKTIECQQGRTTIASKKFDSPHFKFSFIISPQKTQFSLRQLTLMKGVFNLKATLKSEDWQVHLTGNHLGLQPLKKLLLPTLNLSSGTVNFSINANGKATTPTEIQASIDLNNLSVQSSDGKKASENLHLNTTLHAIKNKDQWYWQHKSLFKQGNIYIQPLYLENKNSDIIIETQGEYDLKDQQIILDKAHLQHSETLSANAYGTINLKPTLNIVTLNAYAQIEDLQKMSAVYLAPILETTEFEGLLLNGNIEAGVTIHHNQAEKAYFIANGLQVQDAKKRFKLQEGVVVLNWSNNKDAQKTSTISWRQLDLFSIPLPRTYFNLRLKEKHVSLVNAFNIPLLGGNIQIKKFEWEMLDDNSPHVDFAGAIQALSLEKLTSMLDVEPLLGNISGDIPGIHFSDQKLNLEGGLKIDLFDGQIDIDQLSISGLGTDFSQFESNIKITGIDLDLLTQKFKFGGMKGRVSGFINDLYMENWQPIQFYAWVGTDDNDDSDHKISQKAVENLANIGGGGAVDFV